MRATVENEGRLEAFSDLGEELPPPPPEFSLSQGAQDSASFVLHPSFVAIDLETTGLSPSDCEIIELGAVRFEDGKEVARYTQLVKPRVRHLPDEIVALTGITDSHLRGKPKLEKVADEFLAFIGDLPLVGQNIPFDLSFLAAAPSVAAHFTRSRTVPRSHDAGLLARFIYPCLDSYGLASLSTTFGFPSRPRHRAADDAATTGEIYVKLLKDLRGVARKEISLGLRILEGTTSPLLNTLRAMKSVTEETDASVKTPDPFWGSHAGRNNIFQSSGSEKPTEAIGEDLIRRFFADSVRFNKVLPGYDIRPQQVEMAVSVAKAIREGEFLAVEAGTGVGKSMGYLIPALLSGKRAAVSTHTKHLQDQLFYDEIPRLGQLFKFGFTAALLKGRRNYLCHTKWLELSLDPQRLPTDIRERAVHLTRWVESTQTGDLTEVTAVRYDGDDSVNYYVASEPGYCTTKLCTERGGECPLSRIRKAATKADVVIVNHSLVLSDYLAEGALLGDVKQIIFDEAHHLEQVATDQFGTDLIQAVVKSALERAARHLRKNGELRIRLALIPNTLEEVSLLDELAATIPRAEAAIEPFFTGVHSLFDSNKGDANYSTPYRYTLGDAIHGALMSLGGDLSDKVSMISKGLQQLLEFLPPLENEGMPAATIQETRAVVDELSKIAEELHLSLHPDKPNRVYWVEIPAWVNFPPRLKSAPLDVSVYLADGLFNRLDGAILTSATLTAGADRGGFQLLLARTGLDKLPQERVTTAAYGSPFDYKRNCLALFPRYLPVPNENPSDHLSAVAETIGWLALNVRRGMLALFTSYDALRKVEKMLKQSLAGEGIEVLVQYGRSDRDRLIRRFRGSSGGVLLGTDSLWEGIDVPGAALEIVVIAKLPFDVPNDPVVAARIEKMREEGLNPFNDFQLPSAILRTRQGAGRLIRTSTDRGVVVILDSRTVTKGYGSTIRRSIQGEQRIPANADEFGKAVTDFFCISSRNEL